MPVRAPVLRHALPGFRVLDLVRAQERLVDAAHDVRNAVCRVEALIRIGLAREVRVGRDLPAAQVDRLEACLHLLDRLVPGQGAQRVHVIACREEVPEPSRSHVRQRVLDLDRVLEPLHVLAAIRAHDAGPACRGNGRSLGQQGRFGRPGHSIDGSGDAGYGHGKATSDCCPWFVVHPW